MCKCIEYVFSCGHSSETISSCATYQDGEDHNDCQSFEIFSLYLIAKCPACEDVKKARSARARGKVVGWGGWLGCF